ncbi:MAG: FtsX-like permease family protein [bacterium]|nr:FtsX-like permease family protein [bacterium]
MLKNILKIVFRNFIRQKGYSFINISGLTIGLAISIILSFYVIDDLTYDRFHPNAKNIYRVLTVGSSRPSPSAIIPGPLMVAVKEEVPEITGSTRITYFGRVPISRPGESVDREDEENQVRARALITDPGFFDVFSFKIIAGNAEEALKDPSGILLTPEIAEAVFGEEDPIGKPIVVRGVNSAFVSGIVEAPPTSSHIQYGLIIPLRIEMNPVWWDSWENIALSGYVSIIENADPFDVEQKIIDVGRKNNLAEIYSSRLQPLLDVHLGSSDFNYDFRNLGKNDAAVVYTLAVIGIIILLIACINFINLSSARASKRAREVGLRKVVGSRRWQLSLQFLCESLCFTLLSLFFALILIQLSLPYLDTILGKHLDIDFIRSPLLILVLAGFAVIVGLLSGIYPSAILSGFKPINVLKGEFQTSGAGILFRRFLVVFQFAITIALIIGVFIVYLQIDFLKSISMGYNRERILVIPNFVGNRDDILKNRLTDNSGIISMGRISSMPGGTFPRYEIIPEGFDRGNSRMFQRFEIDEGIFNTLDISLSYGRSFSSEFASDSADGVIINETAADYTGWNDPIGKSIQIVGLEGELITKRVVGVVRDFHYSSTREVIEPMFFLFNPRASFFLAARIAPDRTTNIIDQIQELHNELFPDRQVNPFYLDDNFDQQFNNDRDFAANIGIFAGIAVFIAILGLLGMISYAIEQRRQEVAIRKVLGCSEKKIFAILTVDYLKWIALANLIAWPLGYYGMSKWMNGFMYQVPLTLWPYIVSGVGSISIALIAVSFQTIRASISNPVSELRHSA